MRFLVWLFALVLFFEPARTEGSVCSGGTWTYALVGDIDDDQSAAFTGFLERAQKAGVRHVRIDISSPGGEVEGAIKMAHALRRSNLTSTCVARGLAASGAAYLLQHCSVRLATQGTRIVLHRPYVTMWSPMPRKVTPETAAELAKELREAADEIDGAIARRLGMLLPAYRQKVAEGADWAMSVDEALAAKAIDGIES
jgi:ClpP class serine protease